MAVFSNEKICSESVSAVTGTPSESPGARRRHGDEDYQYVYNAGNSQISVGLGATVSAVTGYSVTVSTTTSTDICVGVCKHSTLTTGTYGWLMTRGFAQVIMGANNSAAAGVPIGIGTDGTFAHVTQTTVAAGPILGKAMEAIASNGSGSVYLRLF